MDFRLDTTRLDLPVYLILGRYEMKNFFQFPEEYFDLLKAPSKKLFFFEESGRGMFWEEANLYHDIFVNKVLPATYKNRNSIVL